MFKLWRSRVANLTSCSEFVSESDPVVKNRIEFQWGSKLPGTSSEALGTTDMTGFSQHLNIFLSFISFFRKEHAYKDANDLLIMQTNLRFSSVHYQSDILFATSPHGFMHRKALRIAHGFSSKVIAERKQAYEEGKAQLSNGRLLPFLDILLQAKVI